jgi:hypothetical protein
VVVASASCWSSAWWSCRSCDSARSSLLVNHVVLGVWVGWRVGDRSGVWSCAERSSALLSEVSCVASLHVSVLALSRAGCEEVAPLPRSPPRDACGERHRVAGTAAPGGGQRKAVRWPPRS